MQKTQDFLSNHYKQMADKYCPTVLEEINSHQPKTMKAAPELLMNYRRASKDEQYKLKDKGFFIQETIKEYLDEKWIVEVYNRDSFHRLYDLLQENADLSYQISLKLNQFKKVILNTIHPYRALALDFDQFKYDENVSEQVAWDE